jgi:chromosome partitioning protein
LPGLLEQASTQNADLVILDSAPNADTTSLAAAKAADLILIPCRPAAFDLNAIGTTLSLAAVAGKPTFVLLNAVPPQGKLAEEARATLSNGGIQVAEPVLHHLVAFSHAVNDGRTAQEYNPKSKAANEVSLLMAWIAKQVNMNTCLKQNVQTCKHRGKRPGRAAIHSRSCFAGSSKTIQITVRTARAHYAIYAD